MVWSRIWDWHFSNFGWWNWQLVDFATHRYVDESPNTHRLCQKCIQWDLGFDRKKWGEFISSLRLGGSNFSSGVWDGWTKTWSLDHSPQHLLYQKEVTVKSKFVFQNTLQLDPCGVTVRLQNCGLAENPLWYPWAHSIFNMKYMEAQNLAFSQWRFAM